MTDTEKYIERIATSLVSDGYLAIERALSKAISDTKKAVKQQLDADGIDLVCYEECVKAIDNAEVTG